jgi:hypothetical protein
MYLESHAMVATMLELMDDHIPSLAVHDSIIVPAFKEQRARSVLTEHQTKRQNAPALACIPECIPEALRLRVDRTDVCTKLLILFAVPTGLEPVTFGLGNRCSIRLSYGTNYGFLGCLGFVYRGPCVYSTLCRRSHLKARH